jgi:hypothetical protein
MEGKMCGISPHGPWKRRKSMRTIDVEKEKQLILDQDKWPHWPVLPVKNYQLVKPGEFPECGILFASDLEKPVIYIMNLFTIGHVRKEDVKQFKFESLDAMLAAGWIGD